ncbi:OmpH family outer membrane protein [uncultured Chryseobacterium sp.]|uniref:OmpH family outer membrane protein n=1 Tax=uncultured Chryseobacterium sp. TaxID=259322 RepID=UPI0025E59DD3|nr:OmpH family outer membrane protein [uncultured Chryseobacterium sp.]
MKTENPFYFLSNACKASAAFKKAPVLFFLLFFLPAVCTAQSSAVISRTALFSQLKGYAARQAAADTLRMQLSREVQQQEAGLQKKYRELLDSYKPVQNESQEALYARMNQTDQEKFKLLQEERKLQETRIKSFSSQLDALYAKDLKPYTVAVAAALQQYAGKNKIDMVWYLEDIAKALPYYSKEKDITAAIAEMVNRAMLKKE